MNDRRVRIGVVGFSRSQFDKEAARRYLAQALSDVLKQAGVSPEEAELVSGLTNAGVPKLAYGLAASLGLRTVGISARRALRVRSGVFPVDHRIIVGQNFGDESEVFIEYIDFLIRVGGGPQSRHEVELFKAKLGHDEALLSERLIEYEVRWFGK